MALLQPGDLFPNGTASIELLSGSSTKITPTSQSGNAYVFFETDLISNPNTTQYLQGATFTDLTQSVGGVVDGTGYRAGIVTHPGSSFTLNVAQDIPTGSVLLKSTGNVGLNVYNFPLDYYPGAAAAYSVRQLNTSYTGSAVEVSRDVDTQVQDIGFTANGSLDSTALLEFATNSSQSLLDYATGSAAAYSLRKVTSDSPVTTLPSNFGSGAAAAYSLRKVNANYTGSAIEVRRSSDNTTQDIGFDANGDLDTTALTNFVNEETNAYTSDFSSTEDLGEFNGTGSAAQSVGGVDDAYKFTLSGGNVVHFVTLNLPEFNQTYSVTLDYYIPSGQTVTDIEASLGTTSQHTLDVTGAWTTETFTFVASDDSNPNNKRIRFVTNAYTNVNADGDVFYLKNIVVTQTTADGAVRTWYDQSGNNNDASNGTDTEQPLIAEGGDVVLENNKPTIKFDGANELVASGFSGSSIQDSYFVMNYQDDSNAMWMYDLYTNNPSRYSPFVRNGESATPTSAYGTPSYYVNGSVVTITTRTEAYNELSNSKGQILRVDEGAITSAWQDISFGLWYPSYGYNGNAQEIIIFNSDQSTNRTDIEWEINNYYNIYPQWDRQSAIEVRRSSDDAVQDIGFDANGDLDTGSLLSFVNGDVNVYTSDFSSTEDLNESNGTSAAAQSVGGVNDAYKFTCDSTISFHSAITPSIFEVGQVYNVSFKYYIPSGQTIDGIRFIDWGISNQSTLDEWVEVNETNLTSTRSNIRFFSADGTSITPSTNVDGDVFYLKDIIITQTTADGHVRTWYDQSGNHVTASNGTDTEQPLIVDAGTVVTQSNRPAIKFDGADDYFTASNLLTELDNSDFLISVVYENEFSAGSESSVPRLYLGHSAWSYNTLATMTWTALSGQSLLSFQVDGATQEVFGNGTSLATASEAQVDFTPTDFLVGRAGAGWMDGKIQELIVFNSNQSTNRLGIESNINAYYDIYTNPSASAYVRTWYDQSGNTNDAIQTSESSRPKIVNTGSLVLENGKLAIQFDGVDDFLVNGGVNSVDWGFFSVLKVNETTYNTLYGGIYGSSITNNSGFIHHFSSGGYGYYTNTYNGLVSRSQTTYGQHLLSILIDSTTGSGYVNSVAGDVNKTLTSNPGYTLDIIGDTFAGRRYHGSMQELIIFDSDQRTNRQDIEAQINSFYKIYN